jgi:hypothetical protein
VRFADVRAVMTNAVTDREDMNEVRHQLLTMTETRRLRYRRLRARRR